MATTKHLLRDLRRGKIQLLLLLAGIGVPSFISTFTGIHFYTFAAIFEFSLQESISLSFITIQTQFFLLLLWILSVLIGALTLSTITDTLGKNQRQDIALMKAIGANSNYVYSMQMTKFFLIILSGLILGILGGTSTYYVYLLFIGFFMTSIPRIPILTSSFVYLFIAYLFGYRPIIKTMKLSVSQNLQEETSLFTELKGLTKWFSNLGVMWKLAGRNLARKGKTSFRVINTLLVINILITFTLFGGSIVYHTNTNYITRGYGEHVIAIGSPDMLNQYQNSASMGQNHSFLINFQNQIINESIITSISNLQYLDELDTRLVLNTTVYEVPTIEIVEGEYNIIGDSRQIDTLVIGIRPNSTVSEWITEGVDLNQLAPNAVFIGDSLSLTLFDDSLRQRVNVYNSVFEIEGILLDPFLSGKAVYLHQSMLETISNITGSNLILVTIQEGQKNQFIESLLPIITNHGLAYLEVDDLIATNIAIYQQLLQPQIGIAGLSAIISTLSIASYLMISITSSLRDYTMVRAIGANKRRIQKAVSAETFILIVRSFPMGLIIGLVTVFLFLLRYPVIPTIEFLLNFMLLLALNLIYIAISLIMSRIVTGRPVIEVIQKII